MKFRLLPALALATALASTVVIAVRADAQQGAGPRPDDRGGPRMEDRAAPSPMGDRAGPRHGLSAEDRAAFLDARIAAVHAGLKLTSDQQKLWPAIEDAVRDGLTKAVQRREEARGRPPAADAIEAMRRRANTQMARGEAMRKFTDAAQPLYASLTDDQKRRLPMLLHGIEFRRMAMGEGMRRWRGHDQDRHERPGFDHAHGDRFGGRDRDDDRQGGRRGGDDQR